MESMKFGRWTIVSDCPSSVPGNRRVICVCDCGTEKSVRLAGLKAGQSKSCGCLRVERAVPAMSSSRTKHSMCGTPEYAAWAHMIQRCHNPKDKSYPNYGGRGIEVYQEWRESFASFLAHIGKKPSQSHTLERVNSNKGYEPGNVRWATRNEQASNKRSNYFIVHDGQEKTVKQLASEWGCCIVTVTNRVRRLGLPIRRLYKEAS